MTSRALSVLTLIPTQVSHRELGGDGRQPPRAPRQDLPMWLCPAHSPGPGPWRAVCWAGQGEVSHPELCWSLLYLLWELLLPNMATVTSCLLERREGLLTPPGLLLSRCPCSLLEFRGSVSWGTRHLFSLLLPGPEVSQAGGGIPWQSALESWSGTPTRTGHQHPPRLLLSLSPVLWQSDICFGDPSLDRGAVDCLSSVCVSPSRQTCQRAAPWPYIPPRDPQEPPEEGSWSMALQLHGLR